MDRITLSHDRLTFSAMGCGLASNEAAPLVVLLHGFPDSPHTFREQLPALAEAGFRAIAPTMRGYEPSSQPDDGDYRITTMARDVLAWLDSLGEQRVHLVGHDWGAAVTYAAGAMAPERFHSLTTLAVPHAVHSRRVFWRLPSQLLRFWYMHFFQLRGLAEWAVEREDWALLRRLIRSWSPGFRMDDDHWAHLRAQFEGEGVKAAMLAYYRQNVSPGQFLGLRPSEAMTLKTVPVRTLAIAGHQDGCMDSRLFDHLFFDEDFPQGIRIEFIPDAGHFLHLERPDVVNQLLLDWIG
ncbi:MAG TPA: alpha/beta hydrolase [Deltaproteobacteria bacterium]|nr:epoxide hydrolase [Deltaproteobacteria bacterium]HCP46562.1 alpha/beta hydrolase [Deltaproteobacteria bacterium]